MDLMKLKTAKRMMGATVLVGAAFFASNASAENDMTPGTGAGTITVQDVNFDQILDIITAGGPDNKLNIFLGNGDGTFNQIFQAGLGIGVDMGLIAAGDVPEITFYQNLMATHLASTCSWGALGLPEDLTGLLSVGGNCSE